MKHIPFILFIASCALLALSCGAGRVSFDEPRQTFATEERLMVVRRHLREIEELIEPLKHHEWEWGNTHVKLEEALHWIERLYSTAREDEVKK